MELNVVVTFDGSPAHYAVSPDKNGIYKASLIKYEGQADLPPTKFFLLRGTKQWCGNIQHEELLTQLGNVIEQNLVTDDFLFPNGVNHYHSTRSSHSSPDSAQQR